MLNLKLKFFGLVGYFCAIVLTRGYVNANVKNKNWNKKWTNESTNQPWNREKKQKWKNEIKQQQHEKNILVLSWKTKQIDQERSKEENTEAQEREKVRNIKIHKIVYIIYTQQTNSRAQTLLCVRAWTHHSAIKQEKERKISSARSKTKENLLKRFYVHVACLNRSFSAYRGLVYLCNMAKPSQAKPSRDRVIIPIPRLAFNFSFSLLRFIVFLLMICFFRLLLRFLFQLNLSLLLQSTWFLFRVLLCVCICLAQNVHLAHVGLDVCGVRRWAHHALVYTLLFTGTHVYVAHHGYAMNGLRVRCCS